MKDVRFRFRDEKGKRWFYSVDFFSGHLIDDEGNHWWTEDFEEGYFSKLPNDQYSGKDDEFGKGIFESDLIMDDENFVWEVFYEDGCFRVINHELLVDRPLDETERYYMIVGNIYENKDLLSSN